MTTKNLFSLSLTDRINYVKSIVTDIKQGTRLHNQQNCITARVKKNGTDVTNCGTAFCIAGWIFNDCFEDNKEYLEKLDQTKSLLITFKEKHMVKNLTYSLSLDHIHPLIEGMVKIYIEKNATPAQQGIYKSFMEKKFVTIWAFASVFLEIATVKKSKLFFDPDLTLEKIKENLDQLV